MTTTTKARLYDSFASVATRLPEHTAIVEGEVRLTYAELLERVDRLAAILEAAGIGPGDRVAVVLPNGIDFIVVVFAVWKLRAILAPLHVRYQEEELQRFLVDGGSRAILAAATTEPILQSILGKQVGVEQIWLRGPEPGQWIHKVGPLESAPSKTPNLPDPEGDWPAVIQYSTGSTGKPKRVTRSHNKLVAEFLSVSGVLGITPEDRILGAVPFYHSYGISNAAILPILGGTTLYAVNDFFPRDVARLIARERITGFPGVPFMYHMLAEQKNALDFSSIRYALCGGTPLPPASVNAFHDKYGVRIRQQYGSTETGCICIERVQDLESPSVGLPIPGVSLTIVNDEQAPLGANVVGNVGIRSSFAVSSYDNIKGKADSFFLDGVFYPGDLGSLHPDGRLTLEGRTRQYINVAGNKVDPTEVEALLMQHPSMKEAVVVGVEDGAAGQKLKAVLVTSTPCTRTEIMEFCVPRLSEFKRPRIIEFRDEIPKSPLGKILRKYLVEEQSVG